MATRYNKESYKHWYVRISACEDGYTPQRTAPTPVRAQQEILPVIELLQCTELALRREENLEENQALQVMEEQQLMCIFKINVEVQL